MAPSSGANLTRTPPSGLLAPHHVMHLTMDQRCSHSALMMMLILPLLLILMSMLMSLLLLLLNDATQSLLPCAALHCTAG